MDIKNIESQSEYVENLSSNLNSLNIYMKTLNHIPLLSPDEEKDLFIKIKNGDQTARDKMIESNLRLVVHVAKNYTTNATQDLMDLIQEGNFGLIKAIDKYDINQGTKFSTYATYWIKQAIGQAINDNSRTIRLPNNAINTISRINKKIEEIERTESRIPSNEELSEKLDINVETILNLNNINQPLCSLEFDVNDNKETVVSDLIADEGIPTPEEALSAVVQTDGIIKLLRTLDEREQFIITKRYGIGDGIPQSLDEIGQTINLTKERVRQLEIVALRKWRSPLRQMALREYV